MTPELVPPISGVIEIAGYTSMVILILAFAVAFYRLVKGPTAPNQVIALDLLAMLIVAMMVNYALFTNDPIFLDAAIVLALIAFLGTVALSRYLERRR
jgi:multicomponent Na+:H+ antiporter subunit F